MKQSSAELISDPMADWFNERWIPEMGAIDGYDIQFLAALLADAKPRTIVEIGCASGLSTAMIAMIQDQICPAELHSFDIGEGFYVDPSKKVGYLVEEAGLTPNVDIHIHTKRVCLGVRLFLDQASVDFCFIDAGHKHPWPLIDTLAMLPMMKPGAIIVQHDLQMYHSPGFHATGPKILHDHIPEADLISFHSKVDVQNPSKLLTRHIDDNIYAIRVPEDYHALAGQLATGFYFPWERGPRAHVPDHFSGRYSDFLGETYGRGIQDAFNIGLKRYNSLAE